MAHGNSFQHSCQLSMYTNKTTNHHSMISQHTSASYSEDCSEAETQKNLVPMSVQNDTDRSRDRGRDTSSALKAKVNQVGGAHHTHIT